MTTGWIDTLGSRHAARAFVVACAVVSLLGVAVPDALASAPPVRVGSAPVLPKGARRLGALPAANQMQLTIGLQPRESAALQALATAVSTPGSPAFHRYLTVGQFARRFGATGAEVAAVQSSLRTEGLTVGNPTASGLTIPVSGTVADVDQAFSVSESQVALPSGRTAYANAQAPEVQSSLAPDVQSVIGLDNVAASQPQGLTRLHPADSGVNSQAGSSDAAAATGPAPCASATAQTSAGAYTANEIAGAYGLDGYYAANDLGAGQTVALFEEQGFQSGDIQTYQTCYETSASVATVNATGVAVPYNRTVGDDEAALDIEQVIGLAPLANIAVYEAPLGTSPEQILAMMASDDTAKVISSSWGSCEALTSSSVMSSENTTLQEMAVQGQSFFVSSGDLGSTDCYDPTQTSPDKNLAVVDPASQPFATAVGGTSMGTASGGKWSTPTDGSYAGEFVWNDADPNSVAGQPDEATGGGVSQQWPMPAYQVDASPSLGVIQSDSAKACSGAYCRQVPDVSADADPNTGYVIAANGHGKTAGWGVIGGTSASAPLWAAFTALANASTACNGTPLGFENPALYEIAGSSAYGANFNDITQNNPLSGFAGNDIFGGANSANPRGEFPVLPGYDMTTGLGTPIAGTLGSSLCAERLNPPTITVANPGAQSGTAGQSVSVQLTASDSGGDVPTYSASNLPAGLSIDPRSGLISGTPTTAQTATVTVIAADSATQGSTSFSWTVAASSTGGGTGTGGGAGAGGDPGTGGDTGTGGTGTRGGTGTSAGAGTGSPSPSVTPGKPTASSVKLSGLGVRRPRLTFTLAAGLHARPLSSVSVALPAGLSFAKRAAALAKGVVVRSGSRKVKLKLALKRGVLTITFASPVTKAAVTIATPAAVTITRTEATKVRQHKVKQLIVTLVVTDTAHGKTTLHERLTQLS